MNLFLLNMYMERVSVALNKDKILGEEKVLRELSPFEIYERILYKCI